MPTPFRSPHRRAFRAGLLMIAAALLAGAMTVQAEVWGYVDDTGLAHVAKQRVDDRYQLFFKGDERASAATAQPPAALHTPDPFVQTAAFQHIARDANSARFATLIEHHATQHEIDPALVKAIVAVESGFEPGAISPKGARGLMQVMPETAARYGISADRKRSAEQKLMDPGTNLQVGTRYLRDLLERFANDLTLALAAYNAGEMAVERYHHRVPPYPETVQYVKRVQQFYAAFRPSPALAPADVSPSTSRVRIRGTFLALPAVTSIDDAPVM